MTENEKNEILNKANTPDNQLNLDYLKSALKALVQAVDDVRNQVNDDESNLYMIMNLIEIDETLKEEYIPFRRAITESFLMDKFRIKKY